MHSEDLVALLSDLVAIDSVNPSLVPQGKGEAEIARYAAGWLERRGLEVHLQETGAEGRPNVVAVARGSGGSKALMLNSHLDTVGVAGMENPHQPLVKDGRLYGRGAEDTKGALAAFMLAAYEAKKLNLRGDVILAGVSDEEYASIGSQALVREWRAEAAIVGEPTGLALATAHKGFVLLEVETTGVAAHGSRPLEGVDAIVKMGKFLCALDDFAGKLLQGPSHPLLGTRSIHASLIQGGEELSSYPASCRLQVERRTLPGETAASCETELRQLLSQIAAADPQFKGSVRAFLERHPLEVPAQAQIVTILQQQISTALGVEVRTSGVSYWTDASILNEAGIPAVVFGPTGGGLHSAVEWVDLQSVEQCAEIVLRTAEVFCS